MMQISKNRFLDALLKLMLFSAMLHIVVLACVSVAQLNFSPLNYFSIVSLDVLFPAISDVPVSQGLSLLIVIILYTVILLGYTKKSD